MGPRRKPARFRFGESSLDDPFVVEAAPPQHSPPQRPPRHAHPIPLPAPTIDAATATTVPQDRSPPLQPDGGCRPPLKTKPGTGYTAATGGRHAGVPSGGASGRPPKPPGSPARGPLPCVRRLRHPLSPLEAARGPWGPASHQPPLPSALRRRRGRGWPNRGPLVSQPRARRSAPRCAGVTSGHMKAGGVACPRNQGGGARPVNSA